MKMLVERLSRYLGVLGLAFWLGGIAFYGAVVIPAAHDILDRHREIGFVTRTVTGTAHAVGFAVVGILAAHAAVVLQRSGPSTRWTLGASLAAMAVAQVVLVLLRRTLDGLLDPVGMAISDRARFLWLHERYLNVTSVLCLAALVHLWAMLPPPKPPPA